MAYFDCSLRALHEYVMHFSLSMSWSVSFPCKLDKRFTEDIPALAHFNLSSIATSDVVMYDRIRELNRENDLLLHEQDRSVVILKMEPCGG